MPGMMKKIAIATLGCKVNQYDSACIAESFEQEGCRVVDFSDATADVYVINTCTVTNRTDFKSRNLIRKALERKKENKNVRIIVTGCYSQLKSREIEKIGNIDLITGNREKSSLLNILQEAAADQKTIVEKTETGIDKEELNNFSTKKIPGRERAFVKIQDGCSFYCAYCIVPFARGKPRSRSPESIISQVKQLISSGYKEFIITGINTGLYHSSLSLAQLLAELENIDGLRMIRISSLEPQLIGQELLSYFRQSSKLCPHFHIPLQSGSNKLLQLMNRKYSNEWFRNLVLEIKSIMPQAAIGTDLIMGLPAETETDFQTTYHFIEELPITYAHVFPYSQRDNTEAARMKDQIPAKITKERCRLISELANEKKRGYIKTLIENKAKLKGILESETGSCWTALSDHYIRLYVRGDYHSGDLATGNAQKEFKDGILIS